MTNERHEKALEAAVQAFYAGNEFPVGVLDRQFLTSAIAAYLRSMDAAIVPREATVEMQRAGFGSRWRLDTKLGIQAATELYADMLSKAPNHFTNGE